ncbi:MAG: TolC family protein, partial [Deltaproteobacteria bacterium]|nr:TolC family protein [Deltaproteobacteria bacterium]
VYLVGLVIGLSPSGAGAENKTVIDLKTALEKALALSPEIREARAGLLLAEARRDEALGHRWPEIEVNGMAGPVPDAEGDQVYSPSSKFDLSHLGPFGRVDVMAIQPIYTFGRLSESIKAAKKGIEVEQAGLDLKASEVAYKVKEYYYGLQLALESRDLLEDAQKQLRKSLTETKKRLQLESSSATNMDLYRLQSVLGMVNGLWAEADQGVKLAQAALSAICGLDDPAPYPAESHLKPVKIDLDSLAAYKDSAQADRPEMRQLRAGLSALESLVKAAQAERLPILYLAGLFSGAYAPGRSYIDNPFVTDEFNHIYGGLVVGVRWKLDFGITEAKIDQAKAEHLKLKAKKAFAQMNLPLEVTQAYLAVKAAQLKVKAAQESYRAARRWFLAASSNFDLGLVEAKEVSDGLLAYATQRGEYFMSVHRLNLGWAKLLKTAGLSQGEG